MNIALVDDFPAELRALRDLLRPALAALQITPEKLDLYPSGEAFLANWHPGKYDLIVLDIYMNGLSGVALAQKIREADREAELVFCTSGNEFASESYEVGAGYYLRKPVTAEKLTSMLRRLDLVRRQRSRVITLPDGYQCLLRSIRYTDYLNHSVRFYIQGEPPHSVYMTHAEAETLLLPYSNFCCVNKGCIVNLAAVRRIADSAFLLAGGDTIPIARRRFKEVQAAYTRYHFETMDEEAAK